MPNKPQKPIAIVEADMALIADAGMAIDDLEGLLLRLAYRPAITTDDATRLGENLQRIRAGQGTIRKYLSALHCGGWELP